MSLEENKAIVHSLTEAFNKQNQAVIDELIAPDYVDHTLQLRGREVFKQFRTKLWEGFPDWHVTIKAIIAEGDKVWVRFESMGTHTGEYRGLAPTGKKITLRYISIYRIVDGKIVEREAVFDFLDFYKQLGVIKYKGFPDKVT